MPILSSIPVLGNLFTWKRKENKVRSLIILITPHLLKSTEQAEREYDNAYQKHLKTDYFYNRFEKVEGKTRRLSDPAETIKEPAGSAK